MAAHLLAQVRRKAIAPVAAFHLCVTMSVYVVGRSGLSPHLFNREGVLAADSRVYQSEDIGFKRESDRAIWPRRHAGAVKDKEVASPFAYEMFEVCKEFSHQSVTAA